jgi:hypothetical protein
MEGQNSIGFGDSLEGRGLSLNVLDLVILRSAATRNLLSLCTQEKADFSLRSK